MKKIFELRTVTFDKHNEPRAVVVMDLESYNDALTNYLEHLKDDAFNAGFAAGQDPYPTEEELADMDADRTSDDSQERDPGIV